MQFQGHFYKHEDFFHQAINVKYTGLAENSNFFFNIILKLGEKIIQKILTTPLYLLGGLSKKVDGQQKMFIVIAKIDRKYHKKLVVKYLIPDRFLGSKHKKILSHFFSRAMTIFDNPG